MSDVASWLTRLGLGKYADVFAHNEIDLAAVPHLRDGDLKELGLPIGHRRKVLAAASYARTERQGGDQILRAELLIGGRALDHAVAV